MDCQFDKLHETFHEIYRKALLREIQNSLISIDDFLNIDKNLFFLIVREKNDIKGHNLCLVLLKNHEVIMEGN